MTRGTIAGLLGALALAFVGCGGSQQQSNVDEYGVDRDNSWEELDEEEVDEVEQSEEEVEDEEGGEEEATDQASAEPEFKPCGEGTVNEAIDAAANTERLNIDDETLARPLMEAKLYEPCKPGRKHFKIKVAIWAGHAAAVDVEAKDKKLAACITEQVCQAKWRDKAKSLNTVEYGM